MSDQEGSSDISEDYSLGHDVKWDISLHDLTHLQSETVEKTYETFCETSPSEWRFQLWLPEVRKDGTCSMSVLLERTDSFEDNLKASIWIDIRDPNDNLIFKSKSFTRNGVWPRDIIEETVEMTPLPSMKDAVHQNAKVSVFLMICFCHEDS